MMNNYIKRSALLLGAAAFIGSAAMAEEGTWRDVTYKLQNPAFTPGWAGALTDIANGVGEVYNGAFDLHQILPDMPAGEYELSVNASYRYACNDLSKANMKDGANHNAYIYINDEKATVKGLFDEGDEAHNDTNAANEAFAQGKFLNTVKYSHKGGDMYIGIANTGGLWDEWTVFDNFKLTCDGNDVTEKIVNADFSSPIDTKGCWNTVNIETKEKTADVNKGGGVYRKTNASPYNIGQEITLPAGEYRFSVVSFLRHGAGNTAGKYLELKGAWAWSEGTSAWDRHVNGEESEANNAYVYATNGWDLADDDVTKMKPVDEEGAKYGKEDAFYNETAIKCLFDVQLETYPENEPAEYDNDWDATVAAGKNCWVDSGYERESAALFVESPELFTNYVEFTLAEESPVWVGIKKDVNAPSLYWNPFTNFKLEAKEAGAGVENVAADLIDANAPVEYYNLQGIRVAEPANGIFIVKQGKKVAKQVIR